MASPSVLTLLLIGINVAVSWLGFRAQGSRKRDHFVFIPNRVVNGKGMMGMILSHFSHADMGHLFLNMFGLYLFAPVVEGVLGSSVFLLLYVASGVASSLAILAIRWRDAGFRALGASGSVAGILFAAIVLRPEMDIMLLLVPIPVPAPIFAVVYVLLSTYFMGQQGSRICHEAHVGGAVAGAALAALLSPRGLEPLFERIQALVG